VQGIIYKKDIRTINLYAPNNGAPDIKKYNTDTTGCKRMGRFRCKHDE
jgi:hypothetical protein